MEEVIKRIIQIEELAQDIIDRAEQEIVFLRTELEAKLAAMETKYAKDAIKKIESIRENELGLARIEVEEKKLNCNTKLGEIEKQYADNVENWTEDIFKSVITR